MEPCSGSLDAPPNSICSYLAVYIVVMLEKAGLSAPPDTLRADSHS